MSKSYYGILGVSKSATPDEIKKAYRKLAITNHPDKHKDEKEKYEKIFKEINDAYSTLSDPKQKAQYDQVGHNAFTSGGGGSAGGYSSGFGGGSGGFGGFDADNIHDIFNAFFGDTNGRRGQKKSVSRKGSDLRYTIEINLEDSFYGASKNIEFRALCKCNYCNGSGSASGSKQSNTCQTCKGSGAQRIQQGFFIMEQECRTCNGSGQVIKDPCRNCDGNGVKNGTRTVTVNIPKGVENGMSLKLEKEGEPGLRGGMSGDLYVVISIKNHKIFQRSGANLLCNIPIRFTQAALGDEIEMIGINKSKVVFDVPRGVQNGQQIAIRGEGMPFLNRNGRGDLIVTISIETPTKLTKEQEDLLKKFEEVSNHKSSSPRSHSFFDNIKDLFS